MAYSMSRPDLQKMRKESEREEIMRKLRLENEIQLLAQERELLTMEICQTEGMQLTDKDCEAQDERELRKCRRERKKELLYRQQRIEEEIMCLQRQLDQLVIYMRYRKNIEMLESDDEKEMLDYDEDDYEQVVIDEYVQSDSDISEHELIKDEMSQPHLKSILKDTSLRPEKNVSFKDSKRAGIGYKRTEKAGLELSQLRDYQATEDSRNTNAKQAYGDRPEADNKAFVTRQQSGAKVNNDPLQSTTLERVESYLEEDRNKLDRFNISDVSKIEKERGDSVSEQNSFLRKMDTEILDLDRRLERLNRISSGLLEKTKDRIRSSSRSEEFINQECDRIQGNTVDKLQNVRGNEQSSIQGRDRLRVPERISETIEHDSVQNRMEIQAARRIGIENVRSQTFVKDKFADEIRNEGIPEHGYVKDVLPPVTASELKPVDMAVNDKRKLPTQRRDRQFVEDIQPNEINTEDRNDFGSGVPIRGRDKISDQSGNNVRTSGEYGQATMKQEMKDDRRQERDDVDDYRFRRDEPYLDRQNSIKENEEKWLFENRKKKEILIKEKERQLKEKQRELHERQYRKAKSRRQTVDPYDEILKEKERILGKQLKALQMKEEQIQQREENIIESEARIRNLEKELLAMQKEELSEDMYKRENTDTNKDKMLQQQLQRNTGKDSSKAISDICEQQSVQDSKVKR